MKISEPEVLGENKIVSFNIYYNDKNNNRKSLYYFEGYELNTIDIQELYGYNTYQNYNDINYILKDLNLEIVYENYVEVIPLKFKQIFKNDDLLFNKAQNLTINFISEICPNKNVYENNKSYYSDLINKIKSSFKKEEDGYYYENSKFNITYIDNNIILQQHIGNLFKLISLNLMSNTLSYEEIINDKDLKIFTYDISSEECIYNNCLNYNKVSEEFWESLKFTLK